MPSTVVVVNPRSAGGKTERRYWTASEERPQARAKLMGLAGEILSLIPGSEQDLIRAYFSSLGEPSGGQ